MTQDMTVDEALLVADEFFDEIELSTEQRAATVLAAEVRRQHAELNRRAEVAERAIQAMNENADRGQAAELDAKRYRWIKSAEPLRVERLLDDAEHPDDVDVLIDAAMRFET